MDGLSDTTATELIAINYAKRQLKMLPDEWYKVDSDIMDRNRADLLPTKHQVNEAVRTLTG